MLNQQTAAPARGCIVIDHSCLHRHSCAVCDEHPAPVRVGFVAAHTTLSQGQCSKAVHIQPATEETGNVGCDKRSCQLGLGKAAHVHAGTKVGATAADSAVCGHERRRTDVHPAAVKA